MAKGLGLQGCSPLDTSGPKPELTTALDLHSLQERRTLTCLRAQAGWRKGPSLSACPSWLDVGFSGAQAPGWAGELALAWACLHTGRMLVRRRSAPRALGCCVGAGTRRGWGHRVPALSLRGCVPLGNLLHFSVLSFLTCDMGTGSSSASQDCCEDSVA